MNMLYAHILLDRSGSMESIRDQTIDAVNEYNNGLTLNPDVDAAISLSLFDLDHTGTLHSGPTDGVSLDTVFSGVKAKEMPKLTRDTYVPRGSTPLNDAIGRTVAKMRSEWHRPGEAIALVIVTDGYENASHEYSTKAVKELLEDCRKQGWLVIYLGANQDAFAEGHARGTATANTMSFDTTNVAATMRSASRATMSYAGNGGGAMGLAASGFTEEERKAAKAPVPPKAPEKKRAAGA